MKFAVCHVLVPAVKNPAEALGVPGRVDYREDAAVSPDRYGRHPTPAYRAGLGSG